jgi:hypothetical protein
MFGSGIIQIPCGFIQICTGSIASTCSAPWRGTRMGHHSMASIYSFTSGVKNNFVPEHLSLCDGSSACGVGSGVEWTLVVWVSGGCLQLYRTPALYSVPPSVPFKPKVETESLEYKWRLEAVGDVTLTGSGC